MLKHVAFGLFAGITGVLLWQWCRMKPQERAAVVIRVFAKFRR